MPLVDYSDSSSENEEQDSLKDKQQSSRKRKAEDAFEHDRRKLAAPPLPTSFHSLYATNVRTSTSDDSSLHAGRSRQVPHVVGNWPTHVYLEWYPSQSEHAILDRVIQNAGAVTATGQNPTRSNLYSFLRSDLGAQLPLHVSLTAPLVLKTEQKESFHLVLDSKLSSSQIKPFAVEVARLNWVANHDKTRFFLVLKLSKPNNDELNILLSICNEATQQLGLPQLYEHQRDSPLDLDPRPKIQAQGMTDKSDAFHISIAWTLEDLGGRGKQSLMDIADDQLGGLKVSFSLLKLKIGNSVIDLPLARNQDSGK